MGPAFNVREARAEDLDGAAGPVEPEALGGLGRMLSWRWLGESEAGELLSARLRTLEALGYSRIAERGQIRGPWDWLRDLVHRQLARPAHSDDPKHRQWSEPHSTRSTRGGAAALREALERLGLAPAELIEGIATIVGLTSAELRSPNSASLRRLEPDLLAILVPFWIEHEVVELSSVGQRWLELPATLYEFDAELIEGWLLNEGALALALAARLEREGLALIGPEGLLRLARARESSVRATAARWRTRLPLTVA